MASGFLCVDKPAGRTSRDITTIVHKHFKPTKVGHVGTLDPLATGVQVLAVGSATRLSNRIHEDTKEYVGRFLLGQQSNTEDVTGEITHVESPPITLGAINDILPQFVGIIEQRPPAFSAAKVDGKRAYDLARAGREVTLATKQVTIHELELVDSASEDSVLREFELRVVCSTGTYLRSLGRDIAQQVGSSAIMASLRRTRVGPFTLEMAQPVESVTKETPLVDCAIATTDLPQLMLTEGQMARVRCGNALRIAVENDTIAMVSPAGRLLAVAEPTAIGLQPRVVLPDAFDGS